MRKRLIALLTIVCIMLSIPNICLATTDLSAKTSNDEITREEVMNKKSPITNREATLSMLLDAGWTMEEIEEWYTEEMLLELDEKALAISNSTKYIVNYETEDAQEVFFEELSRQEFDYEVNQVLCEGEDHDCKELSTMSSTGVLELQPIYGWSDLDYYTGSGIKYGQEGQSGASIWNADSKCYLKQNMGLSWLGNDAYNVQYRFEWMTEPANKYTDKFAVALDTGLVMHKSNPNVKFTFKYSFYGDQVETINSSGHTSTNNLLFTEVDALSINQGKQVTISWPKQSTNSVATNLRGFLTFNSEVNVKNVYENFIAYAQFYHGKVGVDADASIDFSTSGSSINFSISPNYNYIAESHPMDVRADNIYLS